MTILIDRHSDQNDAGDEIVEKNQGNVKEEETELVLDAGFEAPHTNSFGHTFRDYDAESERNRGVEEFYRVNHIGQTVDFVRKMREEYGKLNRTEMSIWECCELLNEFIDESDPDLDEPQIEHLLQTAEAIRKDYPDEDWLHLTGLIHDLGKVLLHPSFGELPQWAVVGDTFPVGCAFDESIVHHKYFKENPDYGNLSYNTKYGIYTEDCGLDNVLMSWGHDDYMYLVAKENQTTLPPASLFIIRYHSFYALHKSEAYKHLMNNEDRENMKWLKVFNKYDLYSKSKVRINVEEVKPYYLSLINKVLEILKAKKPQNLKKPLTLYPTREAHSRGQHRFPPTIELSQNNLSGPIWKEFGNLKKLHVFNLNANRLSGSIPSSLSEMTNLEALDLSNNRFSGSIPESLKKLTFLSKFSVANNSLSGRVPSGGQFETFPNSSFEGNHLCGDYLPQCQLHTPDDKGPGSSESDTALDFSYGVALGFGLSLVVVAFRQQLLIFMASRFMFHSIRQCLVKNQ
ncbi:Leucine-rich repeat [Arabidopsis thaliana x Arabidopsis arenosa]|uniref:inositol oxygenase n=1 Tax=Arabidopsis thaliana x Arabidopsis arenosa TaxID=1240361 RepID=A0A8T2C3G1_9BRAS|nr:Leucine-rich repeat [Arabidopsis thaliana x Arabidopsis arenosa]